MSSYPSPSLSCVSPSTTSSSITRPHRQWHPVYCLPDAKAQTHTFYTNAPSNTHTCSLIVMRTIILVCITSIYQIHTFIFSCIVSLSFRHTLFHTHIWTHTQTMHYSLCLGILHFDEGGSVLSNQISGSRERPSQRRQQGGSETTDCYQDPPYYLCPPASPCLSAPGGMIRQAR